MLLDEGAGQGDDVFCLGAEKTDRLYGVAKPVLAERKHFFRGVNLREQGAGRLVDPLIGRLG